MNCAVDKFSGLIFSLLCFFHSPVFAFDIVDLDVGSIETDLFSAENVVLKVDLSEENKIGFSLSVAALTSSYLKGPASLLLSCSQADFDGRLLRCQQGNLSIDHAALDQIQAPFELVYDLANGKTNFTTRVDLAGCRLAIDYNKDQHGKWLANVVIKNLVMSRLAPALAAMPGPLKDYAVTQGQVNLDTSWQGTATALASVVVKGELADAGIDGPSILEDMDVALDLDLKRDGTAWHSAGTVQFSDGAMYVVPGITVLGDKPGFYIEAGNDPVNLMIDVDWSAAEQTLQIQKLVFQHPGVLDLQVTARIAPGQELLVPALSVHANIPDLNKAYAGYLQPLVLQTDFNSLETSGGLELDLKYMDEQINSLDLRFDDVYLDDAGRRFSISGLNGGLALNRGDTVTRSSLRWDGMSLYRLLFGSGNIVFESKGEQVKVLEWQDVNVLDGTLRINDLRMHDLGSKDFTLALDGTLTPVSMQAFTQAVGWPLLSGKLSGDISGLRYSHNSLALDGDILVRIFDGEITVANFGIRDVFSNYSMLSADIGVDNIDLEQLTDTFAFGKIEGSFSGVMRDLVLEDWRPAYFEAEFATPPDDDKPHRISRKALENLSEVSGGLSGALSGGLIRYFSEYSYGRLGFSCRLNNGICEMGGVEETENGFYLLTRGGLLPPWVEVKGAGRSIKWKDLIGGLKRIAEGEVKID